jgi:hypothetical protein
LEENKPVRVGFVDDSTTDEDRGNRSEDETKEIEKKDDNNRDGNKWDTLPRSEELNNKG